MDYYSRCGGVIWLTGLSGSGKTTLSVALREALLIRFGIYAVVLDGDEVRQALGTSGFTRADRDAHITRIGKLASLLEGQDHYVICSFVSPYAETRQKVKEMCTHFLEVFMDCPLEVCEERDVKGLYARARKGEIKGFTGIDDPYEVPTQPDLLLSPHQMEIEEEVACVLKTMIDRGLLRLPAPAAHRPPARP